MPAVGSGGNADREIETRIRLNEISVYTVVPAQLLDDIYEAG
jgi:hypothetical protein